jgi:hypothetical protein
MWWWQILNEGPYLALVFVTDLSSSDATWEDEHAALNDLRFG